MKKLLILFVMAAIVELAFVNVSLAADPNMPKRMPFDPNAIRGRVLVEKDANGVVTAVKIQSRRTLGDYNVVLDEKGKELADTMASRIVQVEGKVEEKDGVKWLTIESYKELRRPQGRPGEPNMPRPGRAPAPK
ncbi:MAG: hypothetical protein A2Y12_12740 [Planctomycetes bacterium GWF2_42_9]|nr:MAG: hypothetical protein A2Y12_12740 [Planctomycetes bacterium GWF2_42_9]